MVRNAIREDVFQFLIPGFLVFCAGLGVALWEFVARLDGQLTLSAEAVLGVLLVAGGQVVMFVALFTLGRFYSATLKTREGHELIQHGIYARTRHPIYLGALLVSLGSPMCLSSRYGPLVMALLVPIFLHRILIEERMLTEEFGDEYESYARRTKKLVPFLY